MKGTAIIFPAMAFAVVAAGPVDSSAQPTSPSARMWVIENDHPYDFRVIVRPRRGPTDDITVARNGGIGRFRIGNELHDLTTVQITLNERFAVDHDPINVTQWTMDSDVTRMSEIVTPLKIGRTEVTRTDGSTIYQAMPDFPTNRKYDALRRELERSAWTGDYGQGNQAGVLQLNGGNGEAGYGRSLNNIGRDRTRLRSMKYSAGDSAFYIAGEWLHQGQQGVMALKVDPERPWQSDGFYIHGRGRRYEGAAWRLGSVQIPVVVVIQQAAIVDSNKNVLRNVAQGQQLVVRQAAKGWCWVSEPGGSAIGWIESDSIKVDR